MSRRKPFGLFSLLTYAAGAFLLYVLWLIAQHAPWMAAGLIAPVVVWKWFRRPPSIDKLIRSAMGGFHAMRLDDWQMVEQVAHRYYPKSPQRGLLYALRVASVVPTLAQVKVLAGRWSTVHRGGGTGYGFLLATPGKLKDDVWGFLCPLFQDRLRVILTQQDAKTRTKLAKAKNGEVRAAIIEAAIQELRLQEVEFDFDLPGNAELFEHYRTVLATL